MLNLYQVFVAFTFFLLYTWIVVDLKTSTNYQFIFLLKKKKIKKCKKKVDKTF